MIDVKEVKDIVSNATILRNSIEEEEDVYNIRVTIELPPLYINNVLYFDTIDNDIVTVKGKKEKHGRRVVVREVLRKKSERTYLGIVEEKLGVATKREFYKRILRLSVNDYRNGVSS